MGATKTMEVVVSRDKPVAQAKSASATPSDYRAAWIGLLGVLIGALFGFGGTFLVFLQANGVADQASANRAADIRRAAYSDFVAQTQSARAGFIEMNNLYVLKGSQEELKKLYAEDVSPRFVEFARLRTVVALVAPKDVDDAATAVSDIRDNMIQLVGTLLTFVPGSLGAWGPYNADDFQVRLDDFDTKVRNFIALARVGAI
jgi:hypothetical protein